MDTFNNFLNKKQSEITIEGYDLNPATNKGWRGGNTREQLKYIVDQEAAKGTPIDRIWVSYSDVPRLMFYPRVGNKYGKSTPTGLFAHPAKDVLRNQNELLGNDRGYALVFKTINQHRVDVGVPEEKEQLTNLKNKVLLNQDEIPESINNDILDLFYKYFTKFIQKYNDEDQYDSLIMNLKNWLKQSDYKNKRGIFLDQFQYEETANNALNNYKYRFFNQLKDELKKISTHSFSSGLKSNSFFDIMTKNGYDVRSEFVFNVTYNEATLELPYQITLTNPVSQFISDVQSSKYIALFPNIPKLMKFVHRKLNLDEAILFCRIAKISEIGEIKRLEKIISQFVFLEKELVKRLKYLKTVIDEKIRKIAGSKVQEKSADYEFPGKEEIFNLADKYKIDAERAISDALQDKGRSETWDTKSGKNMFLYAVSKHLAQQYAKKNKPAKATDNWFGVWNKFLRELNFDAIVDFGKGQIHASEKAQGVFLHSKNLVFLAAITNKAGSDSRPVSGNQWDAKQTTHNTLPFSRHSGSFKPYSSKSSWIAMTITDLLEKISNKIDQGQELMPQDIGLVVKLAKETKSLISSLKPNDLEGPKMASVVTHSFSEMARLLDKSDNPTAKKTAMLLRQIQEEISNNSHWMPHYAKKAAIDFSKTFRKAISYLESIKTITPEIYQALSADLEKVIAAANKSPESFAEAQNIVKGNINPGIMFAFITFLDKHQYSSETFKQFDAQFLRTPQKTIPQTEADPAGWSSV